MSTYLLEIGTEEIPARFVSNMCLDLQQKMEKTLQNNRIGFASVQVLATYRRLAVFVNEIAAAQADEDKWVKGPPAKIAFGPDDKPLPPAIGFAKRSNVEPKSLEVRSENGQDYVFAHVFDKGRQTVEIFAEILPEAILSLEQPIAMKWGSEQKTFIRPIHWILSLLDDQVVPFELCQIKAGNQTYGHRFLTQNDNPDTIASGQVVQIKQVQDYVSTIQDLKVMVAQTQRKLKIQQMLNTHLDEYDEALLDEVTYLVEWPTDLVGSIDQKYLDIPQEVLIQCMKKNQKFFPVLKAGKLTNQFVVIADNVTNKNRDTVLKGNESVLIARLEDSSFFWQADKAVSLESNVEKLKKVVFQKNLGTVYDKTQRIIALSQWLTDQLQLQKEADEIQRTALLCKADLVSQMVFELPSLQGKMGQLYAQVQGESQQVSDGIFEHYLPRFSGDILPQTSSGMVVSLADKIDTVVSCFYNGLKPTGSQDPWGVRRAVLGIFQIVLDKQLQISIVDLVDAAYAQLTKDEYKNRDLCMNFISQRMKNYLIDQELDYDVVDAILAQSLDKSLQSVQMAKAIINYRQSAADDMKLIVDTAVRVKRLAPKTSAISVEESLFTDKDRDIEVQTLKETIKTTREVATCIDSGDFIKAIQSLVAFAETLSKYFDQVLVMHENADIKVNRLAFLFQANQLFYTICDFESIVVQKN